MPATLDRSDVLRLLDELGRRDPRRKVFGSGGHDYKLNPPLPVALVEAFEGRHGVSLPEDYRVFITEVGNGGAGPYYGVLPFGKDDDDRDWEGGGLVGDLSRPFRHTASWNLSDSFWGAEPDWPPETPVEEQDRLIDAWDQELEEHYWHPSIMDGAIPLCHKGCALRQWLVIHGEQRGFIWDDLRVDNAGIAPVLGDSGEPRTFAACYMGWLDDSLAEVGETPGTTLAPSWRRTWRRLWGPGGFREKR